MAVEISLRLFVLTVYVTAILASTFLAYSRVITGDDFMKIIILILGSVPGGMVMYVFLRERLEQK